jgi:hypothetical protein
MAQGPLLALIFLLGVLGFGGLIYWGITNLNALAVFVGSLGEVGWFFAGKYIL